MDDEQTVKVITPVERFVGRLRVEIVHAETVSPEVLKVIELMRIPDLEIDTHFDLPPHMLGIDASTFSCFPEKVIGD